MNVGELKKMLDDFNDEDLVVMSSDAEGNYYSELSDVEGLYYSPDIGDIMDEEELKEYSEEGFKKSVVLWPSV